MTTPLIVRFIFLGALIMVSGFPLFLFSQQRSVMEIIGKIIMSVGFGITTMCGAIAIFTLNY